MEVRFPGLEARSAVTIRHVCLKLSNLQEKGKELVLKTESQTGRKTAVSQLELQTQNFAISKTKAQSPKFKVASLAVFVYCACV